MIIFLYGEDTFGSGKKLKDLKHKFITEVDASGNSVNFINGVNCKITDINALVGTPSLFSSKKMIIIENIFQNKDKNIFIKLQEYLITQSTSEDVLIFIDKNCNKFKRNKLFKFLLKQQFVQEFAPLTNIEVVNFIKTYCKKRKATITIGAINKIQLLLGNNLWQISNNLEKLIHFRKNKQIEETVVGEFVHGEVNENIFALIDAISTKNKKLALKLFEQELEAGQAETYLFHMIIRQFKILLLLSEEFKNNLSPKQIATKLKIHPFVAQKGTTQAKNFSNEKLKSIFNYLLKLDSEIKNGKTNAKIALELLIVKL